MAGASDTCGGEERHMTERHNLKELDVDGGDNIKMDLREMVMGQGLDRSGSG